MGGSAQGITSGLDKPKRGLVDEPGGYAGEEEISMSEQLKFLPTEAEMESARKHYPQYQRPEGEGLSRFLTSFGLDLMSRPPQGGFLSTAAASAKEPLGQLYKDIDTERAMKYQTDADLFKTLVEGKAEALSGTDTASMFKDEKIAQLTQEAFDSMYELNDKWKPEWNDMNEKDRSQDPEYVQWRKDQQRIDQQLDRFEADLGINIKDVIGGTEGMANLQSGFKKELINSEDPMMGRDGKPMTDEDGDVITIGDYYTDETNKGELQKRIIEMTFEYIVQQKRKRRGWTGATGGRAGYANGELVEQADVDIMTPQGDMAMQETVEEGAMPDQLSYEELRSRLPQEISNEIVQLLVSSAEALSDFAEIQTQQDVDNFNAKYGVNLLLPSEA
tara:strand:- start:4803 stop:5969 length:1167 start_codon:yes stop_codon:yes gene_type:complete